VVVALSGEGQTKCARRQRRCSEIVRSSQNTRNIFGTARNRRRPTRECIVAKYLQKVSPEPFEGVPRDRCAIIWTTWRMCERYPGVLRKEAERTCFVSGPRARLIDVWRKKGRFWKLEYSSLLSSRVMKSGSGRVKSGFAWGAEAIGGSALISNHSWLYENEPTQPLAIGYNFAQDVKLQWSVCVGFL
jgi:hypothetical protein